MSLAVVTNLAKSYGAATIFRGASFRIEPEDRVGLVGPNGAGKSTLLLLLAGLVVPDDGLVALAAGTRVGYLAQDADLTPERTLYDELREVFAEVHAWEAELLDLAGRLAAPELLSRPDEYTSILTRYADLQARFEHAGGYTIEQRVRQVLDGLGFSREQQAAPAAHLSGGQRTRAALGKLLLQHADLLLLDEPTNHLDLAGLEWLEDYLSSWPGAVIVVSHDRYFLDRVTARTIEVADSRVTEYPGNYTRYVRLRAERLERWAKDYGAQQDYIERTEDFIRRYKAGQRSKEARGRQTLLDRLERIERPPAEAGLHFSLGAAVQSGEVVLRAEALVVGYARAQPPAERDGVKSAATTGRADGGMVHVALGDAEILRGERVGLIGPNGSGKTTLLRTIVGQLPPLEGRLVLGHNVQVGYYAQTHEGLSPRATILDEVRRVSHLSEEGARSFLGRFLFTGDDVFKAVGSLSGGERSRVALAKLTLQGANCLVLDEPTNHLDLPSRQMLERLLGEYDGTLVFVSHDRYFVDALATRLWVLEDGQIASYAGNYSRFRARAARDEATLQRARATKARSQDPATRRRSSGEEHAAPAQHDRAVEHIEAAIVAAEGRLVGLEEALREASAAADVARIMALADEYETQKRDLEQMYADWERQAG
jgi:ATP-binding cassette, subfamily F, member 3